MSRKRPSDTPVVAVAQKPASRLRVRIQRFHAVAKWTWNANDDVCGICQSAFEGVAPGVKYPGDECPVVWGKCGHAFHLVSENMFNFAVHTVVGKLSFLLVFHILQQCVSTWLNSSRNTCPICRSEWEFGSNERASSESGEPDT